jgi:hypothetical protein
MRRHLRYAFITLLSALWLSPLIAAADVKVLFDVHDPAKTIFPSNIFTKFDVTENTFRRVNLPKPATCAATPAPISCSYTGTGRTPVYFTPELPG